MCQQSWESKKYMNIGEIDVNLACSGEKTNDPGESKLPDYQCNGSQLDIYSNNILKVDQTSTKLKINYNTEKNLLKAYS